jgi:hypothetical protein
MSRRPSRLSPAEPLLDDPRWVPLVDVHQLFQQRTGSSYLAAVDLLETLRRRTRGLRSMVRYLPRERIWRPELPERELLSADYWDDTSEIWPSSDGLLVRYKRGRVFGYFFVWEPDVKGFFGNKTSEPKPGSAGAWFNELYPNDEWRLKTAKDIANEIRKNDPKGPGYTSVRGELKRRRETSSQ